MSMNDVCQEKRAIPAIPSVRRGTEGSWVGRPLHHRVREQILHDLTRAGLASGERYGTEQQLADRLQVSRNTLRKAMVGLEREGYLRRRQRVGVIVGSKSSRSRTTHPTDPATTFVSHQRLAFILPPWDDTLEGFYSGRLVRELSSPKLSPPLAVEIRHHDDPLALAHEKGTAIVATDPDPQMVIRLRELTRHGVHVIVVASCQPMEGLVGFFTDYRPVVRDAVKKFYQMGHSAVGLVTHDPLHLEHQRAYLGYLDAHRELDLPIHPRGIVQETRYEASGQTPDVRKISAWVCTFLGAVNLVAAECKHAGLSVPDDVSLLSLDDPGDAPMAALGKRLTVARPDPAVDAARIHEYLSNWREDRIGTLTPLPSTWIDRETIAPPARQVGSRHGSPA